MGFPASLAPGTRLTYGWSSFDFRLEKKSVLLMQIGGKKKAGRAHPRRKSSYPFYTEKYSPKIRGWKKEKVKRDIPQQLQVRGEKIRNTELK